ncbi:M56 family metallopeptidase [uncultured Gimesia sp.]|uniref:M56 family metallopeptidase n=1 Tax=uncultured Gimesia sp. TaxID=1678688 RepID=UPI0030D75ED7|tara:strand:+ start:232987 stop:235323 length:2337 start_codon:yes stop_codon:yes gene_type:complete
MNEFLFASNYYNELSEYISFLLISTTIAAAILAAPVLLVNLFARRWLTAGQMGLLWCLVLIRLTMPYGFSLESSYSLQNLFVAVVQESTSEEPPVDTLTEPLQPVGFSSRNAALQNVSNTDFIKAPLAITPQTTAPEVSITDTLLEYLIFFLEWFFLFLPPIWFTGAMLILGRMLFTHWRFTRKVNRVPTSTDQRLLQLWKNCCQQIHVRRHIPIIVFDDISQPSVMGAVRPKLLLPTDVTDLDDDQLRLIMLHELAHITRRDLGVNWILFGLRLFHWWNPLYWLAATRFHSLREQSRDAMVLRWREQQDENSTQSDYPREYSELLLTLALRPDTGSRWRVTLPVSLLGFLTSPLRKRSLANRLKALRSATVKIHPLQTTAVITVIAIFTATGLADIKDQPEQQNMQSQEDNQDQWSSGLDCGRQPPASSFEPLYVRIFEVTEPIKNISEERKIPESQTRQYLLGLVNFQLDGLYRTYQPLDGQAGGLDRKDQPFGVLPPQAAAKYDQDNRLVVRAPESFHEELDILLNAWAKSGCGQVSIQTIEIATSADIAAQAGIEWTALEGFISAKHDTKLKRLPEAAQQPIVQASIAMEEYFPVRVAVLNEQQELRLIKVAQSAKQSNLAFGPKATVFNGQRIFFNNLVYRPFVIDVQKDEAGQLKPKLQIIEEGRRSSLRPTLTEDHSAVRLEGFFQQSEISHVQTIETLTSGKTVTTQHPSVEQKRIRMAANLKEKQSLLISLPATLSTKPKLFQYLLVKTNMLGDPEAPADPVESITPIK